MIYIPARTRDCKHSETSTVVYVGREYLYLNENAHKIYNISDILLCCKRTNARYSDDDALLLHLLKCYNVVPIHMRL